MHRVAIAATLCIVLAPPAALSQAWPARTVRIVVPHPPGGPGDVPPRGFAQSLSQSLGQPFIVENREGADGLIGVEAVRKSAPDGYTFIATSAGTMIVNPSMRRNPPYDVFKFTPIVHTGTLQQLILAALKAPGHTLQELFAAAKAKPEAITVGTFGSINLASLFVDWSKANGMRFYPVPYKSASQGLLAIQAGQVDIVTFAAGPGSRLVQAGKLKALAISPRRNDRLLPGVPSLREAGASFDFTTWWGWFAPAGIERGIVARLNGEVAKLIADPGFNAKFLASQGLDTGVNAGESPEAFDSFIRRELSEFQDLMRLVGIKPQ
ncbi:MAG: tripartite tricarboxylate transporter substrate binding protein [Burkholderiales bacterium]|nr:tripartite tricarboxylate transporter substrate binding protein [Burkholderiales bacterium]